MAKNTWGGYRPGSGRRPKGDVAGVSHHTRAKISSKYPILVTMTTKKELGSLRKRKVHEVIRECLVEGCDTRVFRICHYALGPHEIHLIVEAQSRMALSRGMQGASVRVAKALNRLWERNGSVFRDRYATDVLASGARVRRALAWLYCGFRNRAADRRKYAGRTDPFSSARYFDGWKIPMEPPRGGLPPVVPPRTELLARRWRRSGLIRLDEIPPVTLT